MTMDREIEGRPTADYLWNDKQVVPFLKVDKGLADEAHGAQVMKPMPAWTSCSTSAEAKGIFGTKMRSVIKLPGGGIEAVVDQQFEIGRQILAAGLVPIIEPEVDIHAPRRPRPRTLLKAAILAPARHARRTSRSCSSSPCPRPTASTASWSTIRR